MANNFWEADPIAEKSSASNFWDADPVVTMEPQKESGDTWRGAKTAAKQLPQLGYGLIAGVGAVAESAFGEGGASTDLKKYGVEKYQAAGQDIAKDAKESDSLTYSWDQAKQGNYGAMVDWLQYGIGYGGVQALEALASGGIGMAVGKATLKGTAEHLASGMVAKETARIAATAEGATLAADAVGKMAVANVASKIGQLAGIGAQAFGMEGGEIGGGLAEESVKRGIPLTGAEIAKGLGTTLAAGGLEFVGDKFGVDVMLGKSGIFKPAAGMAGFGGKVARGGIAAAGAIPVEAGTEYLQTGLEEYGQGKEANILPWNQSEEAQRQAFDAAGLGGLGGGVMAVGGGLISKPQPTDPIRDTLDPDTALNKTLDQAISDLTDDNTDLLAETSSSQEKTPATREFGTLSQGATGFGQVNELADLVAQEQTDLEQRRGGLIDAQQQDNALRMESGIESTDARVAGTQAAETRAARLQLLDGIYANPKERSPGMTFLAQLEASFPHNPNPTAEEKQIIAKRESAHQAFGATEPPPAEVTQEQAKPNAPRTPEAQIAQVDEFLANGYSPIAGGKMLANAKGKKLLLTVAQREYFKTRPIQEAQNGAILSGTPENTQPDLRATGTAADILPSQPENVLGNATAGNGTDLVGGGVATQGAQPEGGLAVSPVNPAVGRGAAVASPLAIPAQANANAISVENRNVNTSNEIKFGENIPPSLPVSTSATTLPSMATSTPPTTSQARTIKMLSDGRHAAIGFTPEQLRAADQKVFIDGKGNGIYPASANKIQLERALGISTIPEGTILADGDKPFSKRKQAAMVIATTKGMSKTHKVIPLDDGGYGIAPRIANTKGEMERIGESIMHKDAGEPAEAATPAVIETSLAKGDANTKLTLAQMKDRLIGEVDAAIAAIKTTPEITLYQNTVNKHPDNRKNDTFMAERNQQEMRDAIGYITFDVPGDGVFKVLNTPENLISFRSKIGGGFKATGQRRTETRAPLDRPTGEMSPQAYVNQVSNDIRSTADDLKNAIEVAGMHNIDTAELEDHRGKRAVAEAKAEQYAINIDGKTHKQIDAEIADFESATKPAPEAAAQPAAKAKPEESAINAALRSVGIDPNVPPDKIKALRREAEKLMKESRKMLDGIPAGQPIHSTRDRNLRDKSMEKARKAGELYAQAEELEKAKVEINQTQEQQATAILDRANVTGKDRLDIMRDFKDGKHSLEDLEKAYPVAVDEVLMGSDFTDAEYRALIEKAEKENSLEPGSMRRAAFVKGVNDGVYGNPKQRTNATAYSEGYAWGAENRKPSKPAQAEQPASGEGAVIRNTQPGDAIPESEWLSVGILEEETSKLLEPFATEIPVLIRDTARDAGIESADDGVTSGAVYNGRIHLFRDGLSDRAAVVRTLWHELLHFGFRRFMTEEQYIAKMGELYMKDGWVRGKATEWMKSAEAKKLAETKKPSYVRARAVDEALAELAEIMQTEPTGYQNNTKLAQAKRTVSEWIAKLADFFGFKDAAQAWREYAAQKDARDLIVSTFAKLREGAPPSMLNAKWHYSDPAFMVAWHGSPHDHDKFDSSKIGTGEGAQAYGYGHYFASNKEVAEYYRKGLSYKQIVSEFRDQMPDDADFDEAIEAAKTMSQERARVIHALAADGWLGFDYPSQAITAAFKELSAYDPSQELRDAVNAAQGRLYQVELAPKADEYLSWDKPLSEQSEKVRAALEKTTLAGTKSPWKQTGEQLYKSMARGDIGWDTNSDKAASEYLHSLGIRGIKYLDGSSRDMSGTKWADGVAASKYDRLAKGVAENYLRDRGNVQGAIRSLREVPANAGKQYSDAADALENGDLVQELNYNFVIFDDKDVEITAKFSQSATPARNPFTLSTLNAAIDNTMGNGFAGLLEATGKFKLIESAEIGEYLGSTETEESASAKGYKLKVYRGVSKAKPFNDSGTVWATTSKEVAQAYAEEVFGYEDAAVITMMVKTDGIKKTNMRTASDEVLDSFEYNSFTSPQDVGIYLNSDDSPLGSAYPHTAVHVPMENTVVIDDGNASRFSKAQDQTPRFILSQAKMLERGADGNLSRAFERYIPLDSLDGLEPVPSNNESDDGEYHAGVPITQPIEVKFDGELNVFMVYSGNHRIAQARANGQTHIIAFVEPDERFGRDYIGGLPKRDNPDLTNPDIRYSKDDRILAFVRDGNTYLVADNISSTDDNVKGLLGHEIGLHALQLGRNDAEFQAILKQLEALRKMGNKQVVDAFNRVPKDTPAHLVTEEAAGYLVEKSPDLSVSQKLVAWFRAQLRKIGKALPVMQRMQWFRWADKLQPNDIVYMAQQALQSAPQTLTQAQDRGTFKADRGEPLFSKAQQPIPGTAQPPAQPPRQSNIPLQGGQPGNRASWDSPEPSMFDDLVYKLQDKNIDLKRVVQAIRDTGTQLAEKWNPYLQEELFHGRAAKRVHDFVNTELKPMMIEMQVRDLKLDELDEYLHARHAKEANALIAQRDPNMLDGGSGMTDQQADDYFANLPADKLKKLEAAAKRVDAIIAKTREMYVSYELVSRDQAAEWEQMFQNYVPLMREDHDGGMGIGQGFSIKGKEVKHRTGSTAKVVDIFANIALQREKAIVRGEKNRVTVSLLGLAKLNPNPDFWSFDKVPTERVLNEKTGLVEDRADPMFKSRANVVVGKIKDKSGNIQERAVIFNEHDERAVRMAEAIKNLDATQLNGVLAVSAKITRYFASINTQYNPVFGVTNLVRDVQGAALNLTSTPLNGHQKEVLGHILSAAKGIYLDARAERKGAPATSKWAGLWEELQDSGGMTGYRDLYRTSADRAKAIEHEIDPHNWVNSKWGKVFTANGTLKVPLTIAQDMAAPLFDWLSDYNLMMEGSTRLAIYKTAIDHGMTKQAAASLAKNTTVNFNRKGQSGQQAGALYAFFNAAMQGSARIGQTVFDMDKGDIKTLRLSKTGQKIVYGGVLLGVMQALALAAAGFDDDEPPEFLRERSLIIPVGGKKYISIPMPLGFHALPNVGRISTEFALGGFRKPAEHVLRLVSVFAEAFNPIGSAGISMQTIAPTALDPFAALAENTDWTGKPIYKDDFNSMKPTPGFTRNKDTASYWSKLIAEGVNYATGGTDYTPGTFSPTADQIDYLIGQVTGGVGRETSKAFQTGGAVITGESLPTHKIPLFGRFYGDSENQSSQGNKFYSNLKEINLIEMEMKGRREDRLPTDEFRKENPKAHLIARAKYADNIISKLRKQKRDLIEKGAERDRVKQVEERITAEMLKFNQAVDKFEARTP